MSILNLTQHKATPAQQKAGVVDLPDAERDFLCRMLTFDTVPGIEEMGHRAESIALLVAQNGLGGDEDDPYFGRAMIGGAPFFMPVLEWALREQAVIPVYAFSKRVVTEDANGTKTSRFEHEGFVEGVAGCLDW